MMSSVAADSIDRSPIQQERNQRSAVIGWVRTIHGKSDFLISGDRCHVR